MKISAKKQADESHFRILLTLHKCKTGKLSQSKDGGKIVVVLQVN